MPDSKYTTDQLPTLQSRQPTSNFYHSHSPVNTMPDKEDLSAQKLHAQTYGQVSHINHINQVAPVQHALHSTNHPSNQDMWHRHPQQTSHLTAQHQPQSSPVQSSPVNINTVRMQQPRGNVRSPEKPLGPPFPAVPYSVHLITRISALEDKVRRSPHLQEIISEMSRRSTNVATGLDVDDRIHFSGRKREDNPIVTYGFPPTDEDVDYCLEDTPGLSPANFSILKDALVTHLLRVRQAAQQCVTELEGTLSQQIVFRALPAAEMDRRMQYVVGRFIKARKQILHKFRGYVRNRRWIENVATRQRRGCLTHRQNNILRLWLFSNFSNPYPDNADKRRLIQQTQLNMTQINNWLINARSRVWKPTVETMSGERIRKEMSGKDEAHIDYRSEPKSDEKHEQEFLNSYPAAAQVQRTDSVATNQITPVTTSLPITAAQNVPSAQPVEGLGDDGTWLAPQAAWGTLDFPADALTPQLPG